MKEFFKKVWERFKKFFVWLFKQLKDKKNIIIFIITVLALSSEVWFSFLMAVLTKNKWWWGIGSACWAFWLAPFTPFIPLCIAITVGVRKILDKITEKKNKNSSDINTETNTDSDKESKNHDNQTTKSDNKTAKITTDKLSADKNTIEKGE